MYYTLNISSMFLHYMLYVQIYTSEFSTNAFNICSVLMTVNVTISLSHGNVSYPLLSAIKYPTEINATSDAKKLLLRYFVNIS